MFHIDCLTVASELSYAHKLGLKFDLNKALQNVERVVRLHGEPEIAVEYLIEVCK